MLLKKQFVILFIICLSQYSSCFLGVTLALIQGAWTFPKFLNDVWFTKDTTKGIYELIIGKKSDTTLNDKLDSIYENVEAFKISTDMQFQDLRGLITKVLRKYKVESSQAPIGAFILEVQDHWTRFFKHKKASSSNQTFDSLAKGISDKVQDRLTDFRSNIAPPYYVDVGLFTATAEYLKTDENIACSNDTIHQTLKNILGLVLSYEMMAQTLISFAISWRFSKPKDREIELQWARDAYHYQLQRYVADYAKALKIGDTSFIRACDHEDNFWMRNESFLEFEGFLQQTIYRKWAWANGCSVGPDNKHPKIDDRMRCQHELLCNQFETEAHYLSACIYKEGPYRIYWYMADSKGPKTQKDCPQEDYYYFDRFSKKVDTWGGGMCHCQCHYEDWRISTLMTLSKLEDNYVVVGVRFLRLDKTIYFQIAEGKLGANGSVAACEWVSPTRTTKENTINFEKKSSSIPLSFDELKRWNNVFYFDDLKLPPGHAVTGIQFIYRDSHSDAHGFAIRISGVPLDYETGKLDLSHETFVNSVERYPRRELKFRAQNSILMKPYQPHRIDSDGYTHIRINQSEWDSDFGQSSLPLLDSSPVLTNPLSAIGGVGLFHKGLQNWAGFIALRLWPINHEYFWNKYVNMHGLDSLPASVDPAAIG